MTNIKHELLHLLSDCSQLLQAPVLVFNHNRKLIHHFPERFYRPPKPFQDIFYHYLAESRTLPWRLQLHSDGYYQNFFLYPMDNHREEFTYIEVGPFLVGDVGRKRVKKLLILNDIDPVYEEEILLYFNQLPILNQKQLVSLERILSLLLPVKGRKNRLSTGPDNHLSYEDAKVNLQPLNHNYYDLKERFIEYFQAGDDHALHLYRDLKTQQTHSLGNDDTLRSAKNHLISLITELGHVVHHAGVEREEVFSLCEFYTNFLETKESIEELIDLELNIIQSFITRIQTMKRTQYHSPLVERTQRFIYQNLTENISLSEIAEELKVHPNYLSGVFAKEKGVSISQFINQERVKEAKELLSITDYSLMDISMLLGYNSQSYFTRVFKSLEGIGPKDFRKSIQ